MTGGRLVYSSGPSGGGSRGGTACRTCGAHPCRCEPRESLPPDRQSVHVRFERAGRKGKTVTVASPVVLQRDAAADLLGELKRSCGTGGTMKVGRTPDGRACFDLELQGDHVAAVLAHLAGRGFRTKGAPR